MSKFKIACDCRFGRSRAKSEIEALESAARSDLLMKFKLCKSTSVYEEFEDVLEFVSEEHIKTAKLKLVDSEEFEEERHDVFYEVMNEAVSELLDDVEITGRSGLAEALYGVTMDYNLVHFVMSSFLKKRLDYKPYLLIKNASAEYDLTPDALLINVSA